LGSLYETWSGSTKQCEANFSREVCPSCKSKTLAGFTPMLQMVQKMQSVKTDAFMVSMSNNHLRLKSPAVISFGQYAKTFSSQILVWC
jgi:hypothetical protein